MPKSIIQFIWLFSKSQQIRIILITLTTFPLLYYSLEIPKIIINEALSQERIDRQFFGQMLEPLQYLLTLSFTLLGLVVANGLIKMNLNTLKGSVGEELIRRMRYMLIERLLRFPQRKFEQVPQGEIIATVVQETDPLAGFAGESYALPLFQGGTLLTILVFMFAQNWVLGIASVALVPIQLLIIPRLQKQINTLRKQRVARARKLSSRLGETVGAADEIRIQGTRRYTLAEFSYRFGELYEIRLNLFKKKFFMKFLNNTLAQLTPFMFYAIGGFLVLEGQLTIGALVAAIAAHKDFLSPWKELLNYYQSYQDNKIRYEQIIRQFNPRDMQQLHSSTKPLHDEEFYTPLKLANISSRNELGDHVLHGINLEIQPGEKIAVVSDDIQMRKKFARVISGLEKPDSGHVSLNGIDLHKIDEKSLRLNLGFVNASPYIFNAALSYNFVYSLNHTPPLIETDDQRKQVQKALQAGNSQDWFDETFLSTWMDLDRFNAESWNDMLEWAGEQLSIVNIDDRLKRFAMQEVFNPLKFPAEVVDPVMDRLLAARSEIRKELHLLNIRSEIEFFDESKINRNSSFLENLIFGTFCDESEEHLDALTAVLIEKLDEVGILQQSLELAETRLRKLLRINPSDFGSEKLSLQFELFDETKRSELNDLVSYIENLPTQDYDDACRIKLTEIFMKITPSDWQNLSLSADYERKLLQTRKILFSALVEKFPTQYFPFYENKYNPGLTITNNILFGRANEHHPETTEIVQQAVETVVDRQELISDLINLFMINTEAGVDGSRLPEIVHHSLSLVRTLFKKPAILIMHDALGSRTIEEQSSFIAAIQKSRPEMTLVWITAELKHPQLFEKVYELKPNGVV